MYARLARATPQDWAEYAKIRLEMQFTSAMPLVRAMQAKHNCLAHRHIVRLETAGGWTSGQRQCDSKLVGVSGLVSLASGGLHALLGELVHVGREEVPRELTARILTVVPSDSGVIAELF